MDSAPSQPAWEMRRRSAGSVTNGTAMGTPTIRSISGLSPHSPKSRRAGITRPLPDSTCERRWELCSSPVGRRRESLGKRRCAAGGVGRGPANPRPTSAPPQGCWCRGRVWNVIDEWCDNDGCWADGERRPPRDVGVRRRSRCRVAVGCALSMKLCAWSTSWRRCRAGDRPIGRQSRSQQSKLATVATAPTTASGDTLRCLTPEKIVRATRRRFLQAPLQGIEDALDTGLRFRPRQERPGITHSAQR
jgi:hypothetical protein